MPEIAHEIPNHPLVVLIPVALSHQDFVLVSVPAASPVLVGPAQAEGKVRSTGFQHAFQGHFQKAPPTEPVIVVAEAVDAVAAGQVGLLFHHLRDAQVVIAEIRGLARLVMALVIRLGLGHIDPFRETRAPPLVVFRDRMELRQIEGDQSNWQLFRIDLVQVLGNVLIPGRPIDPGADCGSIGSWLRTGTLLARLG